MADLTTIITLSDLQASLPKVQGAEHKIVASQLRHQEEALFRVWLGLEWYAALKSDIQTSAATAYQEGYNYGPSSMVTFYGKTYGCILATDGTQKPTDTGHWVRLSRFVTDHNNELYDLYLREVIAWSVFHSTVIYEAIRVGNLSVKRQGDNESFKDRPATLKELGAFKNEIGNDANLILQNMDRYLRDNASTFPLYKPNQADSETRSVGRPRRYHGFTF